MKNIFNFKKFTESKDSTIGPSGLTLSQEEDVEIFLNKYYDFYDNSKQDMEETFKEGTESFVKFLNKLDDEFDWFDYSMVPNIVDFLKEMIEDNPWDFETIEEGDLVDFGEGYGELYVLSYLENGILVTKEKSERWLGEDGDGFIIPDSVAERGKVIEKGDLQDFDDFDDEDEDDDWWRK